MLSGLRSSIYRVSRPAIASASAMQPSKAWAQSAVRRGHGFVYNPPATIHVQKLNLVFVDEEGNRATVVARVGETLLDVALRNKIDIEGSCKGGGGAIETKHTENWTETTFGEGISCFLCHVKIPKQFHPLLPDRASDEAEGIARTWDEEFSEATSRLACLITLDKKHDGMVVYVPSAPPMDFC